ncbi:MAG: flagellar biosynthesis anti-sigma factor FlgM [Eubacterium sp.]|nr:flagellar biosynthesis anti-sigma factor FlgM [Eubacterium sp.]
MRIEAYNQVAQLYNTNKTNKAGKTAAAGPKDEFTISRAGQDYQFAKKAVSEASDIREDKVADVKSQIDSGTYQVSADDFASKLLEKFQALG